MVSFFAVLYILGLTTGLLYNPPRKKVSTPTNANFERLQKTYLTVYYLASFSDWLQGPYIYKLYSHYGFEEEKIAILYITGFASSSLFGGVIGHIADKYGRRLFCIVFGIIYSTCCLTKISSNFYLLLIGRVLGGISTSILFTTFEAWYINEHLHHLDLPPEWLNLTFSKASFYNGLLAILAGVVSQIFAESLEFGPASPFLLAIPFLLLSSYLVFTSWTEQPHTQTNRHESIYLSLLIILQDPILLVLGFIQSLFEAVMYTFVFTWTPVLDGFDSFLGIVFSCFMLAAMVGSKMYAILLSDKLPPQLILVLICGLSFISITTVSVAISFILYATEHSIFPRNTSDILTKVCFVSYLLYEVSVGCYYPAMGYLRGRVVPEEHRASIANWFRVPMNIFTCVSLILTHVSTEEGYFSPASVVFKRYQLIYCLCSALLLFTVFASLLFRSQYSRRFCQKRSFITEPLLENDDANANLVSS